MTNLNRCALSEKLINVGDASFVEFTNVFKVKTEPSSLFS